MTAMADHHVRDAFDGYPEGVAAVLREARALLMEVADRLDAGPLTEGLAWGQPSYRGPAGTPVRLAADKGVPAVLVHCQTDLVARFRAEHPGAFRYGGTRAVYLEDGFDRDALALFMGRALTYRRVTA